MSKVLSKLLISVLTSMILILSMVPSAMAATPQSSPGPWYNQNFGQWSTKVFGGDQNEIFGERYTYAQVNWILNSLIALVIGTDITKCVSGGTTGNLKDIGDCASKLAPTNLNKTGMSGGTITGLAYLTVGLVAFR